MNNNKLSTLEITLIIIAIIIFIIAIFEGGGFLALAWIWIAYELGKYRNKSKK